MAPLLSKPRAKRRAYHHGDLPHALVSHSFDLVEAVGADAFSLREAAARCGVAVSAAYKHYASKEALLHAVADCGFVALVGRMEETIARNTEGLRSKAEAEARLVAVGRAYILFAVTRPNLFRLMFGPHGPKGGRGDIREDAPAHRVSTLLRTAMLDVLRGRNPRADDIEARKLVAWALVHGFSMMVIDGLWGVPDDAPLDDTIERLGQVVLESLR
jgi:AcrR family transcriptional regulator